MNIHLMDPGLRGVAGHHFDLDVKVARTLVQAGHRVTVHAHAAVSDAVVAGFASVAPIRPLFRTGAYLDPRKIDPYAGELIAYLHQSSLLAADLRTTGTADVWLWPTLMSAQLQACAGISGEALVAGCVHTPVQSEEHPNGAMWWRHALLTAHRAGMRTRLGAIEPEHGHEYRPLTVDGVFELFPHFFEGHPPATPKQTLQTIGFFGHQRGEKGGALIAPLVKRLVAEGYDVVLHDSEERLTGAHWPGVRCLGFVDDLANEVALCDLVVLPYEPSRYLKKSSGILLEALAHGVPVVVPSGTAPGRWIDKTGAGTQFVRAQVSDIATAIELARTRFPQIAQAAAETAVRWQGLYGQRPFVAAMLGTA